MTANAVREGVEAAQGGQLGESWAEALGRTPEEGETALFEINSNRMLNQVLSQKRV